MQMLSVKEIIISEGTNAEIPVILVTSFSHFSTVKQPSGLETFYVDPEADSAGYRIINLAQKGDLIVAQDYVLTSLGLAKGCTVLHQNGYSYTNESIDQFLQTRYLSAMAQKAESVQKGQYHLQLRIGRNLGGFLKEDFRIKI